MATACYISSTPQPSHLPTYDLLNYLADLVVSKDSSSSSSLTAAIHSETLVAALESFGLLFAALFGRDSSSYNDDDDDSSSGDGAGAGSQHGKAQQARRLFTKMIPTIHYTLLEHPSVEVRVASGEVVGLMFEVLDHHEQNRRRHEEEGYKEYYQQEGTERSRRGQESYQDEDDEDDWDDEGGGGGGGTTTSTTGPFWYRDRQDLVDVLANLATDSNRHRSRKDRCAGRSAFRDILKSVDLDPEGEGYKDGGSGKEGTPQESLKLKDFIVDFHGWGKLSFSSPLSHHP